MVKPSIIEQHREEYRRIGSLIHIISTDRGSIVSSIIKEYNDLTGGLKGGLTALTPAALRHPGTAYMLVKLRGTNDQLISYQDNLTVECFHVDGDKVVNTETNDVVGQITDDLYDSKYRFDVKNHPWWIFSLYGEKVYSGGFLLPLQGEIFQQHPYFVRLMDFANKIKNTRHHLFGLLKDKDIQNVAWHRVRDTLEAEAKKLILNGRDADEVMSKYPELVKKMNGHDWTWQYADRFIKSASEMEETLKRELNEIPVKDALVLWHWLAYNPMQYCWIGTSRTTKK